MVVWLQSSQLVLSEADQSMAASVAILAAVDTAADTAADAVHAAAAAAALHEILLLSPDSQLSLMVLAPAAEVQLLIRHQVPSLQAMPGECVLAEEILRVDRKFLPRGYARC
jgi:hypothetical protein